MVSYLSGVDMGFVFFVAFLWLSSSSSSWLMVAGWLAGGGCMLMGLPDYYFCSAYWSTFSTRACYKRCALRELGGARAGNEGVWWLVG